MKYLKIKVILEADAIIFRDLLVAEQNSLEDLHTGILDAFKFQGKQLASFLVTDGGLQADKEIPIEKLGENDSELMSEVSVGNILKEIGDHLTYIYDYVNEWRFQLEVIEISEEDFSKPIEVVHAYGTAPKESERELSGEDAEKILMDAILGDEFDDLEEDENLFDNDEFDSLDDYEEYH